jgi:hypothetical protein
MTTFGNTVLVFITAVVATGREDNNSPPPNVEVKNLWSYVSTLSYLFTAWTGTNLILYYVFFWVIPRLLSSKSRRFGTLSRFHLQGQVDEE